MKLQFTKMHGAGNDFIVIDSTEAPFTMTTNQLRFIADRHLGIGADQILIVEKARTPDTDFRYRIFNQDGGEVEMCGNGARCSFAAPSTLWRTSSNGGCPTPGCGQWWAARRWWR